jgi:hypothetical protein
MKTLEFILEFVASLIIGSITILSYSAEKILTALFYVIIYILALAFIPFVAAIAIILLIIVGTEHLFNTNKNI